MLGIPVVKGQPGPKVVHAENCLRVEHARHALEVRGTVKRSHIHYVEGGRITIRSGNDLFEGVMFIVGCVGLDIQLAPSVLLSEVTTAEIEAFVSGSAEVLERAINRGELAGAVADHRTRGSEPAEVDQRLRLKLADQITHMDMEPIDIGRAAARPTPPALLAIAGSS